MKRFNHSTLLLAIFLISVINVAQANTPASDAINIEEPYARAVPPGQPNSAVFLQLNNTSKTDHAIVNASSNVSKITELHVHIHEAGMMKMRRIDKIDIPAQSKTTLQPGGLHIMLIQLQQTLKIGDTVTVNLEFEDGSKATVEAPIRKIMMKNMMKGMDNMKH